MNLILTGLVLLTALACLEAAPTSQLRKLGASTKSTGEDGRVYMTKYRKMREKQIGDELNTRAQTERATGRVIQDNRSLHIKQKKKPVAIVNKKSTFKSSEGVVKKLSAQMPSNMHQQQSSYMNMPNQYQPQQQQQHHQPQQFGSYQQSNGYHNERLSTLSASSHPTAAHMTPFMQPMVNNPMQQMQPQMQQMNPAGMDPFSMHQMFQQPQTQMGGMNPMAQGGAGPQGVKPPGSKSAMQGRTSLSKNKNAGNNALREQRFKMAMDQDFLAKNPNVFKFMMATYGPEFQEQMMKTQVEKMLEMQEQLKAKQAAEQKKKDQAAAARRQQQQLQQQYQQRNSQRVSSIDYDDEHMIHDQTYSNRRTNNNNRNRVSDFDHQEDTQKNKPVRNRPQAVIETPRLEEPTRVRPSSRPSGVNQAQPKPQQVDKEPVIQRQPVQPVQQQRRQEVSHISDEDLIQSEGVHDEIIGHDVDNHHQDSDDHHHDIDNEHHHEDNDQQQTRNRARTNSSSSQRRAGGTSTSNTRI